MHFFRNSSIYLTLAAHLTAPLLASGDEPPALVRAVSFDVGKAAPQPQLSASVVFDVKAPEFGAVADGATDDAPAINKALAKARKSGEYGKGEQGTVVYLPPGIYRLDSPLNMNAGQFNVMGAGMYQTVLRGNTGDHAAVVEMVGSGFCTLSNLLIDDLVDGLPPAERKPSSIGVLLARIDAPQNSTNYSGKRFAAQAWYNNLQNVAVRLGTRPSANHGHGTCAYYNFCSEVSDCHDCYFCADTAAMIGSSNLFGVKLQTKRTIEWLPGKPEPMRMWGAASSMTVVRISGANGLAGITGPAVIIAGASDVAIDSCLTHLCHQFLPNDRLRWPKYAIEVVGTSHNLSYRGSIEAYPGALRIVGASVSGLDLRPYMAMQSTDSSGESVPVVMLDKRKVEHPPGSGNMTNVGSSLHGSTLCPTPTPDTAAVIGRLIDTCPDASHTVDGNYLTLGNHSVRIKNAWASSTLRGNVLTSMRPLGSGQLTTPLGMTRAGNILTAADGVDTDAYVMPGGVASLPKPTASYRGRLICLEGGAGQADRLYICEKTANGTFAWRQL